MRHVEIERKFLVENFQKIWNPNESPGLDSGVQISQGYLFVHESRSLRVRLTQEDATIALKGPREGAIRIEYEDSISFALGEQLLRIAEPNVVSKIRYPLVAEDHLWSIDKFLDSNSGLTIAEVELTSPAEQIVIPSWCGAEITNNEHYYNEYLARNPYDTW